MTNWKIFKITDLGNAIDFNEGTNGIAKRYVQLWLDKYVEFSNGYEKMIRVGRYPTNPCGITHKYVEIDMDQTKYERSDYTFCYGVYRPLPSEVISERIHDEMIKASSVDPTILSVTRNGMDRVDRGENNKFKYEIEDKSGSKHKWTYKKN